MYASISGFCHLLLCTSATLHFVTGMETRVGASNRNLHSEAGSCSILHEMFPVDLENLKCLKARVEKNNPREAICSKMPWQFYWKVGCMLVVK